MIAVEPEIVSYALLVHTGLHIPFTSQHTCNKTKQNSQNEKQKGKSPTKVYPKIK